MTKFAAAATFLFASQQGASTCRASVAPSGKGEQRRKLQTFDPDGPMSSPLNDYDMGVTEFASGSAKILCEDAADVGSYFQNDCEERCVCEETQPGSGAYDHVCYRQREELTCMSSTRRVRYSDAWKAITSNPSHPQYPALKALLEIHNSANYGVIHNDEWFLPWHRWYLLAVENVLRSHDCRITIPWWNWSKKSSTWWQGTPLTSHSTWLGTNPSWSCVADGAYANPPWFPPTGTGTQCLRRNYYYSAFPASSLIYGISGVMNTLPTAYNDFTFDLENIIHMSPHGNIGGDMGSARAPRDPLFFHHHAFIDQIWDQWQRKSATHLSAYCTGMPSGCNLNNPLPHTVGSTPNLVSQNFDLKEDHKVEYTKVLATPRGLGDSVLPHMCQWLRTSEDSPTNLFERNLRASLPVTGHFDVVDSVGLFDALDKDAEFDFRRVPQVPPERLTLEILQDRYKWRYENVTDEEARLLDKIFKRTAERSKTLIENIQHPLSPEELGQLKNPASRMLGFDLDSPLIAEVARKTNLCPVGYRYAEEPPHYVGGCVIDEEAQELLSHALEQAIAYNGEFVPKGDVPECMYKKDNECLEKGGHCVPVKECHESRVYACVDICGHVGSKFSSGQRCICQMPQQY